MLLENNSIRESLNKINEIYTLNIKPYKKRHYPTKFHNLTTTQKQTIKKKENDALACA